MGMHDWQKGIRFITVTLDNYQLSVFILNLSDTNLSGPDVADVRGPWRSRST